MELFDNISPLDYRYVGRDKEAAKLLAPYLSENARVHYQAQVEAALVRVLARQGICSKEIAREVEQACRCVKPEDFYKEEDRIRHAVPALANVPRRQVSKEAKPFVHFGATSYDIVDTASALRFREASRMVLLPVLKGLEKTLIKLALRERDTVQVGRTHGQHAEPITFGFALSEYVSRLGNRIQAIDAAKDNLCGKFSGAVGAYNASSLFLKDPVAFEQALLKELGLKTGTHSTQIVEPESLIDLLNTVISTFCVLANLADDLRNLQRSEIAEIAEAFGEKQVGSSTMPHKRNPINFENVKSLWKQFMPRIVTVYLDALSDHQRDLTNSASARFLPEIFAGLYLASERLNKTLSRLVVDHANIERNFAASADSIVAEPLYILLAQHGHANAHEEVRLLTLEAKKKGKPLLGLAEAHPALSRYLKAFTPGQLAVIRDPAKYTGLASKKTVQVCQHWKKALKL